MTTLGGDAIHRITVRECAEILRIHDHHVRKAIYEGTLAAIEIDGKRWVDPADLRRFQRSIGRGVRR